MIFHLAGGCRGCLANPGARRRAQERHGRVKLGGNRCKYLVFTAWPRPEVPGAVEEGGHTMAPGQAAKAVHLQSLTIQPLSLNSRVWLSPFSPLLESLPFSVSFPVCSTWAALGF